MYKLVFLNTMREFELLVLFINLANTLPALMKKKTKKNLNLFKAKAKSTQ